MMVKAMRWQQFPDPVAFARMSQAQIDELKEVRGLTVQNEDKDRIQTRQRDGTWAALMTDRDHADEHDAVIDNTYQGTSGYIYPTLQAAIDADKVSIMVKSMNDVSAITIASGDSVQRIQGNDADTTTVPVNITCNKDDVTFEQLNFAAVTLTLAGDRCIAKDVLVSGTGHITVTGTNCVVSGRVKGYTDATGFAIDLSGRASAIGPLLVSGNTGATIIQVNKGSCSIGQCRFLSDNVCTDYLIKGTAAGTNAYYSDLYFDGGIAKGGIQQVAVASHFQGLYFFGNPDAAKRSLELTDTTFPEVLINGVVFEGSNTQFEYSGATAGANFQFSNVVLLTGTILGAQNAKWANLQVFSVACTVDWGSKTGQIVTGGNIAGTISNVPTDIVYDNVGGLENRGPNLYLYEQAAADADVASLGQIWVKTATPNELWFTDDAGTDHQVAPSTSHTQSHDHSAAGDGTTLNPANYKLKYGATLTIATGSVAVTQQWHFIDTEAAAAEDFLDNATGGTAGQILQIGAANGARTVVVNHLAGGAGQFFMADGRDVYLDDTTKQITFFRSTTDIWVELNRSFGRVGYASVVHTSTSTASAAEFDPFDEDNHAAYARSILASHDAITYTQADGRFTVNYPGVYKIEAHLVINSAAAQLVTCKLKESAGVLYTATPLVHSSVDPLEYTFSMIRDAIVGAYYNVTVDAASSNITTEPGTTMNIYRIA